MSVSRCYTIHCDKCAQWVQGMEDAPLARLRRSVQRMGWTAKKRQAGHRLTLNYCPRCSKPQGETVMLTAAEIYAVVAMQEVR